MSDRFFFGYGSLVHQGTHAYEQVQKARLRGWRRAWRASPMRAVCYLTIVPDRDGHIDGLIAAVPNADWAELDRREANYQRMDAAHIIDHAMGQNLDIVAYAIPTGQHHDPTDNTPLLLSYIDVVVQGYLREYGPDGVQHFFETTTGWQAPILNDRDNPVYPRHQVLNRDERAMVDAGIAGAGGAVRPMSMLSTSSQTGENPAENPPSLWPE